MLPRSQPLIAYFFTARFRGPATALVCFFGALTLGSISLRAENPVTTTMGGEIRGQALSEKQGFVFKGIPFAAPPIGALRWREPQPVTPWSGVREALRSGPPAAQASAGWNADAAAASSEDCLYLDVWTPALQTAKPKAVMVWVHGGGNVAGAGGFDPLYDGTALIKHDIVLVVIEYRLGIFGFFAHPDLTKESPHHASGNYALLDQLAALRWVQNNIAHFGGDPKNVTLFGQSAGSMDVSALLASPLSRGLFQRAISESGPALTTVTQTLSQAEKDGLAIQAKLGTPPGNPLAFLRSVSTADLLKVSPPPARLNVDGYVFTGAPTAVYGRGQELSVPLIIGSNAIELPIGAPLEREHNIVETMFGAFAPKALAFYGLDQNPPRDIGSDPIYGDRNDQIGSDFFRLSGVIQGEWHAASGYSTWQYELVRAIPPHPKVAHSGDLPYVFGNLLRTGSQAGEFTEVDHRLSDVIQRYWTNFAKTGNPNGPGLPNWPGYNAKARQFLQFTAAGEEQVQQNPRGAIADIYREEFSGYRQPK